MSLYVNRVRYKGGSPTLGASSGIINNAVLNGHDFYDDDYNPAPPAHDYSQDYFTVEPIDGGNITIQFTKSGSPSSFSVYYSHDGVNWNSILQTGNITLADKVYLKANVNSNHWGTSASKYWKFNIPQDYKVYGNIMSLIYGDNFLNQTSLKADYEFCGLFNGSSHLVDAENLVLPAITMTQYCYQSMFNGCTSLTSTPALPATTLAKYCYQYMFSGCTSLTSAPELPATTLRDYCYTGMFSGCSSLIHTPSSLSATTLAEYCYSYMFNDCTSLTSVPELPATTLAYACYQYMFRNCTSLFNAPELPAKILANYCYRHMFYGCTSLTTSPELPATTLANYCYQSMFYGCTLLNKITCLATNISATSCTNTWVTGVSATGTFIKNPSMTSWTRGNNGIPSGWAVQDYVA